MRLPKMHFLFVFVFSLSAVFHPGVTPALEATYLQVPGEGLVFTDVPLPDVLFLCGEPMPLQDPRVFEMLERELTISAWDHAQVIMWVKRAGRYFPYIEKKLADMGLPDDLKYLAVAESALIDYIRSRAGATGTWQFMSHTAKSNGLRHQGSIDERRNFEISTGAALQHLKDLKETFGKWTLAMAAYNCGEACVEKAMEKQRIRDYYRLNLPRETERYVFRIAAIKLIMEDPGRYGYRVAPERIYAPLQMDTVTVTLSTPVHMTDFALALDTDFKTIKEFNPQFIGYYFPRGRHEIRVPAGKGEKVKTVLAALSKRTSKHKSAKSTGSYTVRAGDSLSKISKKTGVPMSRIKSLNKIKGSVIHKGQKLRLE